MRTQARTLSEESLKFPRWILQEGGEGAVFENELVERDLLRQEPVRRYPKKPDVGATSSVSHDDAKYVWLREREQKWLNLKRLIDRFKRTPFSMTETEGVCADPESAEAAKALINWISREHPLPRVACDEDGNIVMLWETPEQRVLLIVEATLIHAVVKANGETQYVEDQNFDRMTLPADIKAVLPRQ